MIERVLLASPRGFCAGVVRAIETVERALELFGPPVYVRRAIVHNAHVVARLASAGARFVDDLDDVPVGGVVIFSAHGVPASVREQARMRDLRVVDATCPLVVKVHKQAERFSRLGFEVLLIGHAGHDEVVGTLGQVPGVQLVERVSDISRIRVAKPERIACLTQTTLSPQDVAPIVDQLRRRFPALALSAASDICFATRNRQEAVTWLAQTVDVVLVVGDRTSSNSRHLREAAAATGTPAYLIESVDELQDSWLTDSIVVGVSAGASTPAHVVGAVVERLCRDGAVLEEERFREERVTFRLPRDLERLPRGADSPRVDPHVSS